MRRVTAVPGRIVVEQYPMPTLSSDVATERRSFLGLAGLAGAGLAALAAPAALGADRPSPPAATAAASSHPTRRDIAILRFLAAAELIETDLWQQYAELAQGNPRYGEALETHRRRPAGLRGRRHRGRAEPRRVHQRLPALDRRRAGQSRPIPRDRQPAGHRAAAGRPGSPTSPTSRSTPATSRATRAPRNPDFGATFDQIATIRDQPAIPTSNSVSDQALAGIVRVAAFHFAWVEQGGTSLYDQFVPYIISREVLRIVSSIYATEAVHYAIFRDSLNGITAFQNGAKLVVPDLTEGRQGSSHVFPKRCTFLSSSCRPARSSAHPRPARPARRRPSTPSSPPTCSRASRPPSSRRSRPWPRPPTASPDLPASAPPIAEGDPWTS